MEFILVSRTLQGSEVLPFWGPLGTDTDRALCKFENIKVWIRAELIKHRNWFNQYTRNPNFKIQTINLDISRMVREYTVY